MNFPNKSSKNQVFNFNIKHLYNFFPEIHEKFQIIKKENIFYFLNFLRKRFQNFNKCVVKFKNRIKLVIAGSYELKNHNSDLNFLIRETKSIEMVGFKKD